jgi:seryl-tRNA synthetase
MLSPLMAQATSLRRQLEENRAEAGEAAGLAQRDLRGAKSALRQQGVAMKAEAEALKAAVSQLEADGEAAARQVEERTADDFRQVAELQENLHNVTVELGYTKQAKEAVQKQLKQAVADLEATQACSSHNSIKQRYYKEMICIIISIFKDILKMF